MTSFECRIIRRFLMEIKQSGLTKWSLMNFSLWLRFEWFYSSTGCSEWYIYTDSKCVGTHLRISDLSCMNVCCLLVCVCWWVFCSQHSCHLRPCAYQWNHKFPHSHQVRAIYILAQVMPVIHYHSEFCHQLLAISMPSLITAITVIIHWVLLLRRFLACFLMLHALSSADISNCLKRDLFPLVILSDFIHFPSHEARLKAGSIIVW